MNEQDYFERVLDLAQQAGPFGCIILAGVAYVFYRRWLSADEYIKELNRVNTKGREENLKEYVSSLAVIKERMNTIQNSLQNQK